MRLLTWNLFHGRAVPDRPRPLLQEFAAALAGWSWDVALLQEVPPWWPPLLARACGAEDRSVLTSRNALLPVRRAAASRRPDLAKSNGGGADAILVRPPLTVTAHGHRRLRWTPERRMLHAVRLGSVALGPGDDRLDALWVGNIHAQPPPAVPDPPADDVELALERLTAWSPPGPLVLGGDLNVRRGAVDALLPAGWARIASQHVDHVLVRGLAARGPAEVLEHRGLSDHPPLAVDVGAVRDDGHRG